MFVFVLSIMEFLNNLKNKSSNLLRIDNFDSLNNIMSLSDLIKSKNIKKIWINEENDETISINKLGNYHITKCGKITMDKIIDKFVEQEVNIGIANQVKSYGVFKIMYEHIYFLIHKIIIPILWIFLIFNITTLSFNLMQKNYDAPNGMTNFNFIKSTKSLNQTRKLNQIEHIDKLKQLIKNNDSEYHNAKYDYDYILGNSPNISLKSWVGSPEVFEECWEVISYVTNYSHYKRLGAELPKGILLEGPPGVGKTHLAKAIASETNSTFISVAGSEFIEMYVGVGASRVRELFGLARKYSPSIIFIDEIDAIGKHRSNGLSGTHSEHDQTLNQLLTEMDGFGDNTGILILGATNRKDMLDKALVRPGRFDRVITIGLPDKSSRLEILNLYLSRKKHIDRNINASVLADLTEGYSGADLKNLINEAAILAARRGGRKIKESDLSNALEKSIVGIIKNNDDRSLETIERVSVHEVGHAYLVLYYKELFDLQKISIKSTYGGAGGYTIFTEKPKYKNDGLFTKDLLFKRLVISMGGKAAETIWYGGEQVSWGATQDLKQSNQLARKMVGIFGMGDDLETFYNQEIDLSGNYNNGLYSDKTKETFDLETIQMVRMAYIEAKKIISENKEICADIIDMLIDKKILTQKNLQSFI